jgi:hypothetical protein
MKKIISIFLLVLFTCPLFSEGLSTDEINKAISAIIDTSYVAASQFLAFQNSEIPSIAIRVPQGKFLPDALIVNEGDLESFLQYFPEQTESSSSNILAPINATVRQQLLADDWIKGEAIVTGVAATVFNHDQSVFSLISEALNGTFPRVGLLTDFTIEGSAFSIPAHVEGVFIVSTNEDTSLNIEAIKLAINDKVYQLN